MRLDRLLGTLGKGTRSEAQRMIRRGEVSVDGQVCRDPGQSVDPETAGIALRGEALDTRLQRHVMLHKPAGLLTAARDRRLPTVMDLLPPVFLSLGCMPVGRLDRDTTGLLLLTTDGEMNHRLLSPARHVDKTYRATVDGPLGSGEQEAFAAGIAYGDFRALPASLEIVVSGAQSATALVTVHEGQYHQIKRMFEAVGRQVTALERLSFGPLRLDPALSPGAWRELTPAEYLALRSAVQMEQTEPIRQTEET